jgi:hypothetical protein
MGGVEKAGQLSVAGISRRARCSWAFEVPTAVPVIAAISSCR